MAQDRLLAGHPPSGNVVQGLGPVVRALAVIAALATVVGRAVAPALPGTAAGIERAITTADIAASLLTQAFAFAGSAGAVALMMTMLRDRFVAIPYRLALVPLGAGVVTFVTLSAKDVLAPNVSLVLALCACGISAATAATALADRRTRAAGFVVLLSGTAAALHVVARVLAIRASDEAVATTFAIARGVATAGLLVDSSAVVVAIAWLVTRRSKVTLIGVPVAAAIAATLAVGSLRGSAVGASLWQVLSQRVLGELAKQPASYLAAQTAYFVDVLAILVACVGAALPRSLAPVISLALFARASADVPLGALALTLAALSLARARAAD